MYRLRLSKSFMDKKRGSGGGGRGYHDFLSKLRSHGDEKFPRGTVLCFRKVVVLSILRNKRRGGHHVLPSKFSCLTVPNPFVRELFRVSQIWGIDKLLA